MDASQRQMRGGYGKVVGGRGVARLCVYFMYGVTYITTTS